MFSHTDISRLVRKMNVSPFSVEMSNPGEMLPFFECQSFLNGHSILFSIPFSLRSIVRVSFVKHFRQRCELVCCDSTAGVVKMKHSCRVVSSREQADSNTLVSLANRISFSSHGGSWRR